METANESPLKKYRRQPKIFIDLPSNGKFLNSGVVYNDTYTQLAVFSMTANDEILFKTPDALINGEATANNIKSCVPSIIDPWQISLIDLDTLLVAIRIATYGPSISVKAKCPHCKTENQYEIKLQDFIDHYLQCNYNDTCIIDNFLIKTRPLTYREFTDSQKKSVALNRALSQTATKIEDEDKRNEFVNNIIQQVADLSITAIINSIQSVEVNGEIETNKQEIVDWLSGTDVSVFKQLKTHTEKNVESWKTPKQTVQCGNDECKQSHKIAITLDQSDFFGKG